MLHHHEGEGHKLPILQFDNGNHAKIVLSWLCGFCTQMSFVENKYDASINRINLFLIFQTLWQALFWSKYIHLLLIFYLFLISQVPNFSNLPKVHNIVNKFGVHIFSQFWNAKKYNLWQQLLGINVFMPLSG
jgi:hypothetical protein